MTENSRSNTDGEGPLIAGFAFSVLLHFALVLLVHPEPWPADSSVRPLFATLQGTAGVPGPALPVAVPPPTLSTPRSQPAPVTPAQSAQPKAEATAEATPPVLYEHDVRVREIFPEEAPLRAVAPEDLHTWYDLYSLDRRPMVRGMLEILAPPDVQSEDNAKPVVLEIKILPDGQLYGIEVLSAQTPIALAYRNALLSLDYIAGQIRGEPVPSVMYLQFELALQPR